MKYVGVDVSKDKLDIFIRPDSEHFIVSNNASGFKSLEKRIQKVNPELIAFESTGGYENEAVEYLVKSGFKVSVINPRYIKDFAKAGGARAKTDKQDSAVIAHYAQTYQPPLVILASEEEKEIDALVRRRSQLIDFRTAELNRLKRVKGKLAEDINEHISWLDKKIKEIDQQLDKSIDESSELKDKADLIKSYQGAGDVVAKTILTQLPEIGKLSNKKISALVGLAPFNRESGKQKGKMTIFGGRKSVRTALYMPAWVAVRYNPVIKEYYQRLIARGKKKKAAITACMHKMLIHLNTIIKTGNPWNPEKAKSSNLNLA